MELLEDYIKRNNLDLTKYKDNITAHQYASEIDAKNWEDGLDIGDWLASAPEQHKRIDWMISMCYGGVLDIGCGNGMVTNFVIVQPHIKKNRVVGLNLNHNELKYASKWKTQSIFVEGLSEKLPFKDESFESIICGEIIEHLVNPEELILECKRVLRPNGNLIITTPYLEKDWHILGVPNPLHVREYTESSLKELVSRNGFLCYSVLSGKLGDIFDYDYFDKAVQEWRKKIVKRRMTFIYLVGVKI